VLGARHARRRPAHPTLNDKSVRIYLASLRPVLLAWSARYSHLREVTRDDVRNHLAGLHGDPRRTTLAAFRSLCTWAKANGVIFANPAGHLSAGRRERPIIQPLPAEQISQAVRAASTAHARLSSPWPPSTPPALQPSAPYS
jgi:site-specific recombinase XerC